jgi:hypothetical protein
VLTGHEFADGLEFLHDCVAMELAVARQEAQDEQLDDALSQLDDPPAEILHVRSPPSAAAYTT